MTLFSTFPTGQVTVTDAQFKAMLDGEKRLIAELTECRRLLYDCAFEHPDGNKAARARTAAQDWLRKLDHSAPLKDQP